MGKHGKYCEITREIQDLTSLCDKNNTIDQKFYEQYDVKRGLRDLNGSGVLTGLTEISEIQANTMEDGRSVPCAGQLFYRGINVEDIVAGFARENRFGFEEVTYLLLFGEMPTWAQLHRFNELLAEYRTLPTNFVRDVIMKATTPDMMNTLARSVLTLYAYDEKANDISTSNVLRQCLQLIANFPLLSVYGYRAYRHYHEKESLFIHAPQDELSTAENILHMLRPDSKYTAMEAHILDIALVLHAEHGGGNNSTFTTHVVTSSGTDTYSTVAASLGSLKGPRHGGANIKVIEMFSDLKRKVADWRDEDEVRAYLQAILNKQAFDRSGLIYGMGHAVYSLSDPRATILRSFVEKLSVEKSMHAEYELYSLVERLAPQVIAGQRRIYKGVSANVDFYSGFVYYMLGLPLELYTPIFAIARISGWSAHRMEELVNNGKIIRPAYQNVAERRAYLPLTDR